MWELLIVTTIVLVVLSVNGVIDSKGFFQDNSVYLKLLKENDYDFLVHAKYGEKVNPDDLFNKRIKNSVLVFGVMMILFITNISFLNILICIVVAIFIFKSGYSNLRSYYKKHLHDIDLLLPYYLKSLEVLVQYYTVPIAIQKSIDDAPDIFKPGLKELIGKIEQGDSSIEPYMAFAKQYPVRDSMRMMRLLYRLGLGLQENKEEQLLLLSKTVSSLQNKAREQKYKERLEKMQNKTMVMLGVTGAGVVVLLLVSMLMLMTNL
ncbi:MAG: hypothetical protein E7166_05085 [Firmicutes bacterium]|nr:hypothetical protein [Bacillota bacterium]